MRATDWSSPERHGDVAAHTHTHTPRETHDQSLGDAIQSSCCSKSLAASDHDTQPASNGRQHTLTHTLSHCSQWLWWCFSLRRSPTHRTHTHTHTRRRRDQKRKETTLMAAACRRRATHAETTKWKQNADDSQIERERDWHGPITEIDTS